MIRKFYLAISFLILFILFLAATAWNYFINRDIEDFIRTKFQSIGGEQFTIDDFSVGFGTVSLNKVELAFNDALYKLEIDELKIGYSIFSLLRGGSISEKTAEEVTLSQPRLTIRYQARIPDKSDLDISFELSSEAEELYRSIIKQYDFIKRITISHGEIELIEEGKEESRHFATQINGWAYTDDRSHARMRLAGQLFDTEEYNVIMYGQLDLERGGLDYLNIDLHDYELGSIAPILVPEYMDLQGGTTEGHFTITEKVQPAKGFNIEGNLKVHDGVIKVKSENLLVENIEIDAQLKDWDLEITESTQIINGSKTWISGRINNILHPELDLKLHSEHLALKQFLLSLLPQEELPFSGRAVIDAHIAGAIAKPVVSGRLTSTNLAFYNKNLDSVVVEIEFDKTLLNFPHLFAAFDSTRISGSGNIDFLSPDHLINFELALNGDFTGNLHDLGFRAAQSSTVHSNVRVFGPITNPVSTGLFDINIAGEYSDPIALDGTFRYSSGQFIFNTTSLDNSFQLDATLDSIFTRASINLEVTNLQKLFAFSSNPIVRVLRNRYKFNISAEGRKDSIGVQLDGFRKINFQKVFRISSTLTDSSGRRWVNNDITVLPNTSNSATGSFTLIFEDELTRLLDLEIGNWVTGEFEFSNSKRLEHRGKLNISGLRLPLLLSMFSEKSTENSGLIYGQITLGGDFNQPQFSGNLWLLEAFVNQLGPIKGQFEFNANPSEFTVKNLTLEDNESFKLIAKGNYDFITRNVDAKIAGSHVQVGDVINFFTESKNVVTGDAMIQVHLKGQAPEIPISGNIIVSNAKILMFHFEEVVLDFGTQSESNNSFVSSDFIKAGRAKLVKGDDFVLEGPVRIPLKGELGFDLNLSGDGNFLALLPDLTSAFGKSNSKGHLDLNMTGRYRKPDFTASKFSFSNGQLHLNSIVKKIENFSGEFEIVKNDYFLAIQNLKGSIQGKPFSITNTNNIAGLNHAAYEALRVGDDDLNLGALILQTSTQGVPLHIPGLMEKGEIGWFIFDGYSDSEKFFITGPWQRPVIRGKIGLRHVNVMYPFDETIGETNPVIRNIINNINWDVNAVSQKDTRYVRQFKTGIYVNIDVDPKNSRLEFKGILKDSTFTIDGSVESTRGEIEYLDLNFRVDKVGAQFNRHSLDPIVFGKAWTVVRDTLMNVPSDVYLTFITVDDLTNREKNSGRWDRIQLKLSSEYPSYEQTQSQLMASLGYSSDTIGDQAKKVVGSSTDNFLLRPLLRPIERQLERRLSLDIIRFSYSIAQNFLDSSFNNGELSSKLAFLRSSRLIIGKYLTENLYLLYTGELKAGIGFQFQKQGVGLQHILGLEYRLAPQWLLQMEYDYNTLLETHKDDKKVWLRHSFPF